MHYEFDACVIKEFGTRHIFLRGLLLGGDPRSALLLIEVQRDLSELFGPTRFTTLRYPAGLAARGGWLERREGEVHYHHTNLGNIYYVSSKDDLVAYLQVSPVDLRERIITTLLDGSGAAAPLERFPDFPQGFPGQAQHPGTI